MAAWNSVDLFSSLPLVTSMSLYQAGLHITSPSLQFLLPFFHPFAFYLTGRLVILLLGLSLFFLLPQPLQAQLVPSPSSFSPHPNDLQRRAARLYLMLATPAPSICR